MKKVFILLLSLLLFLFCLSNAYLVHTQNGPVVGTEYPERLRSIVAFMAIPYGKAERWQAPQPPDDWYEARNGALDLSLWKKCPQPFYPLISDHDRGLEDEHHCLQLDIFSPSAAVAGALAHARESRTRKDGKGEDKCDGSKDENSCENKGYLRPVMVFIHGGAYILGSPHNRVYNGSRLASYGDIVYVSVGYRLGLLGFMDKNYGLLDQRLALQWIKDNIERFGGDPNRITLFGESAGGHSIFGHLISKGSQGLFHRAIIQSPALRMNLEETGERRYRDLLDKFRGNVTLMNSTSGIVLARAIGIGSIRDPPETGRVRLLFPVVDGDFFPSADWERDLYLKYNGDDTIMKIPLIIGVNSEEMKPFYAMLQTRLAFTTLGKIMRESLGEEDNRQLALAYEPLTVRLTESPFEILTRLTSDGMMWCPTMQVAQAATRIHKSVRKYVFGVNPFSRRNNGAGEGCIHTGELPYLFATTMGIMHGDVLLDHQDIKAMELMQKLWTSFAKEDVDEAAAAYLNEIWPVVDHKTNDTMLVITRNGSRLETMEEQLEYHQCHVWSEIRDDEECWSPYFWVPPNAEPLWDQYINTAGAIWTLAFHYSPTIAAIALLVIFSLLVSIIRKLCFSKKKKKEHGKYPTQKAMFLKKIELKKKAE